MDLCEESLTAAAFAGDNEVLADLLERHHASVCQRIAPLIGKNYRALIDPDDVYQVTCIEAFLNIRGFQPDGPGAFLRWLTRIAENNLRDAIRWLDREKRLSPRRQLRQAAVEDSYADLLGTLTGSGTTPSGHAVRSEIKSALQDAIAMLPQDYQTVVRSIDLEQRTPSEVGEAMGRSRAAVYMLHARAHEHLLKLLGDSTRFFR